MRSVCAKNLQAGSIIVEHLKVISGDLHALALIVELGNACLGWVHWPSHFNILPQLLYRNRGSPHTRSESFGPIVL